MNRIYGISIIRTDNIRLRRLDALFAERVLGWTAVAEPEEVLYLPPGMKPPDLLGHDPSRPNAVWPVPYYTRSLDAAWEGAAEHFPIIEISMEPRSVPFHAEVERNGFESMDDADHPAEALVLACLRAVGCSEEELV